MNLKYCASLLLVLVSVSCITVDADLNDYPIILSIDELAEYYGLKIDTTGEFEKTQLIKYIDGSIDLDYEYDMIETGIYDPIYYSISIEVAKTIKDAQESYDVVKGAFNIGYKISGLGTIEIDSLKLPGDENFYAISTYEDEPNGIIYMTRKGSRNFSLIMSGMYTTDHSIILDLINPKIEDLESFTIEE